MLGTGYYFASLLKVIQGMPQIAQSQFLTGEISRSSKTKVEDEKLEEAAKWEISEEEFDSLKSSCN